jgi:Transposase DDE domain
MTAHVVADLLGIRGKAWTLAMDRTNWEFGKTTINILMIAVIWNGVGVPLIWTLLPSAGNSNTKARTDLLDRLHEAFPDLKVAALTGDREFIGDAWMAYLRQRKIPFILRLRENQHVVREDYDTWTIADIARRLGKGEKMILKGWCRLGQSAGEGSPLVRIVVTRLPTNELLALACCGNPRRALARLPPKVDHRNALRQPEIQGLQSGGHAHHRAGKALDPSRRAGAHRDPVRQDRRRARALAPHPHQEAWAPRMVAVRARPRRLKKNRRIRRHRSNNRLPATAPVAETFR